MVRRYGCDAVAGFEALSVWGCVDDLLFWATPLYFASPLPSGFGLGDCAPVYHSMTSKRSAMYRSARSAGIQVEDGHVVRFNSAGLAASGLHGFVQELTGHVVVDLGAKARQNILPAEHLLDLLMSATGADQGRHSLNVAIVRPFRYGDAGAVSHRLEDGCTMVEHSAEGLLPINRGLVSVERTLLPPPRDEGAWDLVEPPARWTGRALLQIARFTEHVDGVHPGACGEWTITDGCLTFVDFTIPNRAAPPPVVLDATTLSPGTSHGPIVNLTGNAKLRGLSVAPVISVNESAQVAEAECITRMLAQLERYAKQPIVYAERPFAILSALIGHVAGFVFDGGSSLSHLAILLREAGCPAVLAPRAPQVDDGSPCTITNGAICVSEPGRLP